MICLMVEMFGKSLVSYQSLVWHDSVQCGFGSFGGGLYQVIPFRFIWAHFANIIPKPELYWGVPGSNHQQKEEEKDLPRWFKQRDLSTPELKGHVNSPIPKMSRSQNCQVEVFFWRVGKNGWVDEVPIPSNSRNSLQLHPAKNPSLKQKKPVTPKKSSQNRTRKISWKLICDDDKLCEIQEETDGPSKSVRPRAPRPSCPGCLDFPHGPWSCKHDVANLAMTNSPGEFYDVGWCFFWGEMGGWNGTKKSTHLQNEAPRTNDK